MSFPRSELAALSTLALVCGFVALTVPPATAASEPTIIRIGAVVDQTGGSTSPLYRAAVELAAGQMNAALVRSGSRVKFEVIFGDSKSNPAFAQSEALRLINQEQVKALVTDSSGVTIAINKLNYDPATSAKQKLPITCFQCSSSFINDANVTESDPVTQAAERDVDNWLFRVFYVAKYEAAVLVQIALNKTSGGKGNATAPSRSEFLPTAAIARWPPASPRSCRRSTRTRRPPRSSTCRRSTSSGRTGPR